jgi:CheY-like chemotaxis protein
VDEAARPTLVDERPEVRALPARDHDDLGGVGVRTQARGDLEAVDAGELDIEEDDLRAQPRDCVECGFAGLRLADHVEARGLENAARGFAKPAVIVDDVQRHCHLGTIVVRTGPAAYTVSHTMAQVLVVDDTEKIRAAVRMLLEKAGHDVLEAATGRECLRVLYDRKPDVVLLDVSMPDMDGWQALERIRELTSVPILMVTARDAPPERVRGLRGGADDYVVKPFEPEELLARIELALRHATPLVPPAVEPAPRDLARDDTKSDPW